MRFRAFLFVALVAWTWPSQVDAQIYAWRDVNGTLVLSDRSIDAPTTVYKVSGTPSYVTTRPAEDDGVSEDSRYEPLIQEHATRRALRPELVRAVIQVESGFNARALSPKGAMGLMQLMPATARGLGVTDASDPLQNVMGGAKLLGFLTEKYGGNLELALAAYNAGSGAVDKHGGIPPFGETQKYVPLVMSAYERFKAQFGGPTQSTPATPGSGPGNGR